MSVELADIIGEDSVDVPEAVGVVATQPQTHPLLIGFAAEDVIGVGFPFRHRPSRGPR